MNCREVRRAVISKSRADRTDLERHRAQCSACGAFAARFEAVESQLGRPATDRGHLVPDARFSARVMSVLPERPSPLAWASLRLLPVTAALALTLLAWCLAATPAPSDLWAEGGENDVLTWVSSDDL